MTVHPKEGNDSDHHFEIHASIVFQLGEDLITDVVQALVELVKNSYDADAGYAKIAVSSTAANDHPETYFPGANGWVSIEDNGDGMNDDIIRAGWLTISNSLKREMKRKNKTTKRGRTPLGDKGLGRLGVQRLGNNVEIFTKPEGESFEYHVGWSWSDFVGENTLSQIGVRFQKSPSKRKKGTTILISDLHEPAYWEGEEAFQNFEQKLSQMISPYGGFQEFEIFGKVNNRELELAELTERVRKLALLRYRIDFDPGNGLSIHGRARLNFIRPNTAKELPEFTRLVEEDGGKKFFDFLASRKGASGFSLRRGKGQGWFAEFSERRAFKEIPALHLIDDLPANPGPFLAEIDSFSLGSDASGKQSIFDNAAEYRGYIKRLNGIRVFRDGFGVRLDRDWIGLGAQWTSGSSWYGLRPENTTGYVAITAKDNAALVETTDREGFKATPHFENFKLLFAEFLSFAHDSQEFLRRGWLEFRNENQRGRANVDPSENPRDLQRRINEGLSKAANFQEPLSRVRSTLEDASKRSREAFNTTKVASQNKKEFERLKSANVLLDLRVREAQELMEQLQSFIPEASRLQEIEIVLQNELQMIHEQLEQTYETVSLGLTAEALSHEIHNISDQMAQRTQEIIRHLTRQKISDVKIFAYTEYVKSSIAALRKQLTHLAPSLRYVRERREDILFSEFLAEASDYHQARWTGVPIKLEVSPENSDFRLRINRGKLTQVFDNLILNSEFWIREEFRTGRLKEGIISIEIHAPYVLLFDNGPGIDPAIESTLFDPFITRKPKQRGRGLGLFIVRQLLDTESCLIELTPTRNGRGRQFQFKIDFAGATDAGE